MFYLFGSWFSTSTRGNILALATCCFRAYYSGFFDVALPLGLNNVVVGHNFGGTYYN